MMRVCVRMLSALLVFTCVVGCVAPGGTIALTKPTLAITCMLAYEKRCNEWARAEARKTSGTPEVLLLPWGVVWLEDEGVFAAGRYLDSPQEVKEVGTPIPLEWVEVRMTKADAVEYFRLLLDGHTALAIAQVLECPDTDAMWVSFLCYDQVFWFPYSVDNRRVLGREFLKVMADAMQGSRVKKPSGMLSEAGRLLVEELGDVPLEKWPEWYRKNERRLCWDPVKENYRVARESR